MLFRIRIIAVFILGIIFFSSCTTKDENKILSGQVFSLDEFDNKHPLPNIPISIVGGNGDVTNIDGFFNLILNPLLRPGDNIKFNITPKQWVIYTPIEGKYRLGYLSTDIEVTLVPPGSHKLKSKAFLEKVIVEIMNDITTSNPAKNLTSAEIHDEVSRRLDQFYVQKPGSTKNNLLIYSTDILENPSHASDLEIANAYIARQDFEEAAILFNKLASTEIDKNLHEQNNIDKVYLLLKKSADAYYASQNYTKALEQYIKIKNLWAEQQKDIAEMEFFIGNTYFKLYETGTQENRRPEILARAETSYQKAITYFTNPLSSETAMNLANNYASLLFIKANTQNNIAKQKENFDYAAKQYQTALTPKLKEQNFNTWVSVQNNISLLLIEKSNFYQSTGKPLPDIISLLDKALSILNETKDSINYKQYPTEKLVTNINLMIALLTKAPYNEPREAIKILNDAILLGEEPFNHNETSESSYEVPSLLLKRQELLASAYRDKANYLTETSEKLNLFNSSVMLYKFIISEQENSNHQLEWGEANYQLGYTLFKIGTLSDIIDVSSLKLSNHYLKQALTIFSEETDKTRFSDLQNLIGYNLTLMGDKSPESEKYFTEAKQRISVSLNIYPESSTFLDSLGWVEFKLNNDQEAEKLTRQALKNATTDIEKSESTEHLAKILIKQKKQNEAKKLLTEAIKSISASQELIDLRKQLEQPY